MKEIGNFRLYAPPLKSCDLRRMSAEDCCIPHFGTVDPVWMAVKKVFAIMRAVTCSWVFFSTHMQLCTDKHQV